MSDEENQVEAKPQAAEPSQIQAPGTERAPNIRVSIDLADAPGGGVEFHMLFWPDGVFDEKCQSHQMARDIQRFLNGEEAKDLEAKRAKEKDVIRKGVLAVLEPVTGPLETMEGPSEATN